MSGKPMSLQRNRKMQKSGALTIPADIRTRYGFKKGAPVVMTVEDDGSIRIVPKYPTCAICQKRDALRSVKSVPICKVCAEAAMESYTE